MSVATATLTRRPPRRAMKELIVAEAKLTWREPAGLVLGVCVPVMLLVIFGMAPGLKKEIVGVSPPTTYMSFYVPVLIGMVLTLIALVTLPISIVLQRERAFLRRLSTTPVAPSRLLAAQVVVNLAPLALLAMVLIVVGRGRFLPCVGAGATRRVRPLGAARYSGSVRHGSRHCCHCAKRAGSGCAGYRHALPAPILRRALDSEDVGHNASHKQLHPPRGSGPRHAQLDARNLSLRGAAPGHGCLCRRVRLSGCALVQMGVGMLLGTSFSTITSICGAVIVIGTAILFTWAQKKGVAVFQPRETTRVVPGTREEWLQRSCDALGRRGSTILDRGRFRV